MKHHSFQRGVVFKNWEEIVVKSHLNFNGLSTLHQKFKSPSSTLRGDFQMLGPVRRYRCSFWDSLHYWRLHFLFFKVEWVYCFRWYPGTRHFYQDFEDFHPVISILPRRAVQLVIPLMRLNYKTKQPRACLLLLMSLHSFLILRLNFFAGPDH